LEPLSGYLLLAQQLIAGKAVGAWNFGPQESDNLSVAELLDELARRWGKGAHWQQNGEYHRHEAGLLRLDSSQARSKLDWCNRLDCKAALAWTVDWHRAWLAGENMHSFTLSQIDDFMAINPQ
jgi:CDP-glucose 4,6-dehydratase